MAVRLHTADGKIRVYETHRVEGVEKMGLPDIIPDAGWNGVKGPSHTRHAITLNVPLMHRREPLLKAQ